MISVIPEHPHIFVGLKKKKTNRSIFFFVDFLILKPRRKIKSLPSWISGGPRLQRTTGKRLGWELSPGSLLLLRAFPGSLRPRALSREVPGPILASARAGQSGAAMSSDFEGYEQDFAVLTAEITNKIARVPRLPPDEKKQMVANVEKQLEEAKELLEQMDLEVREIPPQSRGMYSNRMRSYKQEMGKLETDFKRSRIAYSDEVRNELLGDDGNSSENQLIKLREERAHLLDNTERLERSSRRLEAGYQIAVETVCPIPTLPLMENEWTSSFGDQALQSLESKLARRCWKTSVMTEKRYSEHVKDFEKQMPTWGKAPGF
ncbi:vesicle transport through interaction with t-SNAREs homolog 1A isoform X8 [Elephas maximus indicus]|uniref:vesicle transport through interaction with t-SNAREs homolog 1A isoform X8 n=1 Tax=Elephas maximus indicus TaxID=99487 RepID=UPI002116611C|nr:vesicle transport through interaction with t-SNAREs homolog 1A isoform X8 [Elephas maximus indicus]XP_049711474.1 vesicle transport through interaction with t-SNAREs homolog 1A isoform X8 [Elephas maximus indicus]XP_049711475.1 vesicle transport through interaction with t-SNAREs homolog 1A isoform X8 [Elephas maximus indicus]XP_049711476.1 vesicle transport through interaction with t-SNAREs homolog 1A isoform X8 [Elephas maximus indicus]XP_049711477.1 vesicle transport through interaction wi